MHGNIWPRHVIRLLCSQLKGYKIDNSKSPVYTTPFLKSNTFCLSIFLTYHDSNLHHCFIQRLASWHWMSPMYATQNLILPSATCSWINIFVGLHFWIKMLFQGQQDLTQQNQDVQYVTGTEGLYRCIRHSFTHPCMWSTWCGSVWPALVTPLPCTPPHI